MHPQTAWNQQPKCIKIQVNQVIKLTNRQQQQNGINISSKCKHQTSKFSIKKITSYSPDPLSEKTRRIKEMREEIAMEGE
jgi:hypothetical protein